MIECGIEEDSSNVELPWSSSQSATIRKRTYDRVESTTTMKLASNTKLVNNAIGTIKTKQWTMNSSSTSTNNMMASTSGSTSVTIGVSGRLASNMIPTSSKSASNVIDSESECSDSDFEVPKKRKQNGSVKIMTPQSSSGYRRPLPIEIKKTKFSEKEFITMRPEQENVSTQYTKPLDDEPIVVLDINSAKNEKIVVHNQVAVHLKAHQIDGIKHMYNCCYGSVDKINLHLNQNGSGCILAHCMGLGKTLQMIAMLHTVINYPVFRTNRILILCPKSTILNWKAEFSKWIGCVKRSRGVRTLEFSDSRPNDKQIEKLKIWSNCNEKSQNASCFIMGYEAFRSLVFYGGEGKKKAGFQLSQKAISTRDMVKKHLLDAADIVVCDEGHMIKRLDSLTHRAVSQIKTSRRIVLTGTPLQNSLMEYHAMVNFVKPWYLGTASDFRDMYEKPIARGQHKDSSREDIKLMRKRSFHLNRELESFVHRQDVSPLLKELPEKFEYVLYLPMSEIQYNLYQYYLHENPYQMNSKKLFSDYTAMRKIWTHPKLLEISFQKATEKEKGISSVTKQKAENSDYEDDDFDELDINDSTAMTSIKYDWWRLFLTDEDLNTILQSPKFEIMFEILAECQRNQDKCLIFSSSVVCLNVVEIFLAKQNGTWKADLDYFRLDGSTNSFRRNKMIVEFNKPQNTRARLFLISAKAGGQGINLTGANRIILLDTSWNPSVDQQSIFRIFRFGQRKKCYIYRLLSMGTMEEKIYSRSVTKQAMSYRVVDKQQKDRNYNMAELEELYTLTKPDMDLREVPIRPKDELLEHLLNKFPEKVYKYHEHNSLLDNKYEEDLTEQEKQEELRYHNAIKMAKKEYQAFTAQQVQYELPSTSKAAISFEQAAQFQPQVQAQALDDTQLWERPSQIFYGKRKNTYQDGWKNQRPMNDYYTIEGQQVQSAQLQPQVQAQFKSLVAQSQSQVQAQQRERSSQIFYGNRNNTYQDDWKMQRPMNGYFAVEAQQAQPYTSKAAIGFEQAARRQPQVQPQFKSLVAQSQVQAQPKVPYQTQHLERSSQTFSGQRKNTDEDEFWRKQRMMNDYFAIEAQQAQSELPYTSKAAIGFEQAAKFQPQVQPQFKSLVAQSQPQVQPQFNSFVAQSQPQVQAQLKVLDETQHLERSSQIFYGKRKNTDEDGFWKRQKMMNDYFANEE